MKYAPLGRMRTGIGAVGDAVAVNVEIAAELEPVLEHLGGGDLAAIELAVGIPIERFAQTFIHADIEIEHDEDRRLQPVGEIERLRAELERLVWIFGE